MRTAITAAAVAGLCLLALLSGCETLAPSPKVDFAEATGPRPLPPTAVATNTRPTGSLFASAAYRPVFEDRRPRLVGDNLTVQIVENVSASQKSTSTVNRTAAEAAGLTGLPFLKTPLLDKLGIGATSSNNFSGKGGTESANTFSGTITVTVVEVLPNGHLVVAGEKQIGVNQNVDELRCSGTVDPRAVQPGSTVASTQVANVRIESKGRGQQGETQAMGWLGRFFMNAMPF